MYGRCDGDDGVVDGQMDGSSGINAARKKSDRSASLPQSPQLLSADPFNLQQRSRGWPEGRYVPGEQLGTLGKRWRAWIGSLR